MTAPVAPPCGRLFQEDLLAQPFWMLVACQLVNLTTWEKARVVHAELARRWPTPGHLRRAPRDELEGLLRPLGLFRRRATSLVRLAHEWTVGGPPRDADDVARRMPGCGRYAADSWAIFVDGRTDVTVTDGKLAWYLARIERGGSDG